RWCRGRVRHRNGAGVLVRDRARGARRELEALERNLVRMRVTAARAGDDPDTDALAHVARRLAHHALLERRRLVHTELEVEVGPVGTPLERRTEDALEAALGEPEALDEE